MSMRDRQFYGNLFFWLFVIAILFRYLVQFVGIKVHIPYFDATMEVLFSIIGSVLSNFAGFLGGWAG